jgi:succinate dehydrogenase/fumarate reductase flavoprotein subunit
MNITETGLGKIVETDVLILGAGAAGSGAAIAARREGVDVVLVEKGKLESCGSAGGGNDHFTAALNAGAETDTCEAFTGFFGKPTSGWTAAMIGNGWFKMIPVVLEILEQEGVKFLRNEDGSYLRTAGFGQPGAWFLNISGGQTLKRKIARRVRAEGAHVFDYVLITKLLKEGGRIAGCLGYQVHTGEFFIFKAKKVICCLGKTVNRVSTNSSGNPFNTWHDPFVTGAYFALTYEVGAKLMNMDIAEQATLIPKGWGAPGMNGINSMGGRELNALGERFMGKYDPMWENGLRRNQIQGTYQEFVEGKGPPFHIDMTHFSEEEARILQYDLMPGDKATYNEYTSQKGINFKRDLLEVEISELGLEGGLCVKENFETTVEGLFCGCVFPYVSGALCGGYYAGTQAARSAREDGRLCGIDEETAEREKERIFAPLRLEEGISYKEFEGAVRSVMDYYMGLRRNQKGMEIALDKLNFIGTYAPRIKARDHHELMRTHEGLFMHQTCILTTLTCLQRKESGRGIYKRTDFPDLNHEMNKPLLIWQEDGRFNFSWGAPSTQPGDDPPDR